MYAGIGALRGTHIQMERATDKDKQDTRCYRAKTSFRAYCFGKNDMDVLYETEITMKIGLINNTAMNLTSSQRYYIHRKLRELGYRVNAR